MNSPQLALDLVAAMEKRDAGIERSGSHADDVEDGWRHQALAMVTAFAKEVGRPFLIEEARAWAYAHDLPAPPDGRAWGAVTRMAAHRKKPRIRKIGHGSAVSSHCSPKCLWEAA